MDFVNLALLAVLVALAAGFAVLCAHVQERP